MQMNDVEFDLLLFIVSKLYLCTVVSLV